MRLKSAYREKLAEAPNIPEEPPQPSESVRVEFIDKGDPGAGTIATIDTAIPEPDEAGEALKRQLEHLRQSEQAQREFAQRVAAQRAAQMAAPAPTLPAGRADRIALWKQAGNLSDEDASFLEERPSMIDNPELTRLAYGATLQAGIERTSPDFAAAMEGNFATLLNRAQAQPAAVDPGRFFEPEPTRLPAPESVHDQRASIVSAPVSRREAGGYREPSLRQIKLTSEEAAIAAASGVSETEYARQKLRMLKAKASGELQ